MIADAVFVVVIVVIIILIIIIIIIIHPIMIRRKTAGLLCILKIWLYKTVQRRCNSSHHLRGFAANILLS